MNSREQVKSLGQVAVVNLCIKNSAHFDKLLKRGLTGERGVNVQECRHYSKLYKSLTHFLAKDFSSIDSMNKSFISELHCAAMDKGLIPEPE